MRQILIGLAVLGLALTGCVQEPERDSTGAITSQVDNADVFAIKVGDCLAQAAAEEEESLDRVKAIPCAKEHASEVYAEKRLPKGAFPGRAKLDEVVDDFCLPRFEEFVGKAYDESRLDVFQIEPTPESWGFGDRVLQCLVTDPEGPVKGSLKGTKR